MFVYSEEPVMSFSDYLVNCGGLKGLWFGTSAKDLITFIIDIGQFKKINYIMLMNVIRVFIHAIINVVYHQ